jgi:anti-sigma B factor antagonist
LKRVMMRPFEIRHQGRFGEASVLAVAGELDVATGLQVKRSVAELLGTGARAVVIDLRETEFVDSTGMGALLWAARRLRAAGGELRIVNVEPVVARTFELAHLDELIAIEH